MYLHDSVCAKYTKDYLIFFGVNFHIALHMGAEETWKQITGSSLGLNDISAAQSEIETDSKDVGFSIDYSVCRHYPSSDAAASFSSEK